MDDLVVDALVELVLIDLQLVGEQVPFLIDLSEFDEHDVTDLSDSRNSTQGWKFFPDRSQGKSDFIYIIFGRSIWQENPLPVLVKSGKIVLRFLQG